MHEQPAERIAELAAHGAVDKEVDEIAEEDAEVNDACGHPRRALVEQAQPEEVADDERHEDDGHWKLDKQADTDDDDQHQRRGVTLGQSAVLGTSMKP